MLCNSNYSKLDNAPKTRNLKQLKVKPRITFDELLLLPDVVSSDAERLEVDRISVLDDHLDRLEVGVHGHVDAGDGSVDLSPVLQFDRHRLVRQLHQKPETRKQKKIV